MMNKIIKYSDGEIELNVSIDSETIWLIAEDIASLFGVQRPAIVKHIGNIYKDEELSQNLTCSILEQVAKDGKTRKVNFYNLDIVISVGYRVNSKKATKFRQWATSILKEYISNGYAINSHKITEQRLLHIENDIQAIKSKIKDYEPQQNHIFYNGQIFDAYVLLSDIIKSAKNSIKLVDNYIDIEIFDFSHDRFLIVDEKEIYHFGASLKDLGKKWFAVSKMDINSFEILEKLNGNNK